jgi:hypothetical protein
MRASTNLTNLSSNIKKTRSRNNYRSNNSYKRLFWRFQLLATKELS